MYHPFIEAAALTIVDIPITFVTIMIFSLILYFMAGLQASAGQFLCTGWAPYCVVHDSVAVCVFNVFLVVGVQLCALPFFLAACMPKVCLETLWN
jgi:ABC-type multidrug transport system permease subunit